MKATLQLLWELVSLKCPLEQASGRWVGLGGRGGPESVRSGPQSCVSKPRMTLMEWGRSWGRWTTVQTLKHKTNINTHQTSQLQSSVRHSPFLCRTQQADDPSIGTFESTLLTNWNLSYLNCFLSAEFILSFQPHVKASINVVLCWMEMTSNLWGSLGDDIIHRVRQRYSDYIWGQETHWDTFTSEVTRIKLWLTVPISEWTARLPPLMKTVKCGWKLLDEWAAHLAALDLQTDALRLLKDLLDVQLHGELVNVLQPHDRCCYQQQDRHSLPTTTTTRQTLFTNNNNNKTDTVYQQQPQDRHCLPTTTTRRTLFTTNNNKTDTVYQQQQQQQDGHCLPTTPPTTTRWTLFTTNNKTDTVYQQQSQDRHCLPTTTTRRTLFTRAAAIKYFRVFYQLSHRLIE